MFRARLYLAYIWLTGILLIPTIGWPGIFNRTLARGMCKFWMINSTLAAKYILGINYRITGEISDRPALYASKHQSIWETAFLQMVLKRPIFVLKKELLEIPLLGLYIKRAGHIAIDRSQGSSALKTMIKSVKRELEQNSNVIIFPEGTRVPPGERIEYKQGIALLYKNLPEVDVIPVSVNSGLLWPKAVGLVAKKRGCIDVIFHPALAKNLSRSEFMEQLQTKLESLN